LKTDDTQIAKGKLHIPDGAKSIVLISDGRKENIFHNICLKIEKTLNDAGIATILYDFFTNKEQESYSVSNQYQDDIGFLTKRFISATEWLKSNNLTKHLQIGLLSVNTFATAAIVASVVEHSETIKTIVSISGRPDLVTNILPRVHTPILFIVGENDLNTIKLTNTAIKQLNSIKNIEVIEDVFNVFDNKESIEHVANLTKNWFLRYL
jgi:hypothetical protein